MIQEPATNALKGKRGLQRIINAAGYSKDGLIAAYRHEAAFRQLVWLHGVLLIGFAGGFVWLVDCGIV